MRRQRGFTLLELMVTISAIGAASLAFVTSANGIHQENAVSKAYCSDVSGLRQAVRLLRHDLRNAASIEELDWTREGDRLLRGRREIARNMAEFEVKADGPWATVRIAFGNRREAPAGNGRAFEFRVRMRNAGRAR